MTMDNGLLAKKLIEKAVSSNITIAFAESCTGGLIAAVLTDIPGSSKAFLGSAVTYSNEAKIDILGVSREIIDEYGAVSSECAEKMAGGAKNIFRSHIALSVTGIAGPDGGSEEKPVGTVWFGIYSNDLVYTFEKKFSGDRASIRASAVGTALISLLERVQ